MLLDLITKNRTCRRFHEDFAITRDTLVELIDLARLSATSGNIQPLKYVLSWQPEKNAQIYPHLTWAGWLEDWPGPPEGERPSAYIVVLGDTTLQETFDVDVGIAAQSITLGATEKGLAGCIIAMMQRDKLRDILNIPDHLEILLILALGKPKEKVIIEPLDPDGNIKYYRDKEQTHHVPKRTLKEIIIE